MEIENKNINNGLKALVEALKLKNVISDVEIENEIKKIENKHKLRKKGVKKIK